MPRDGVRQVPVPYGILASVRRDRQKMRFNAIMGNDFLDWRRDCTSKCVMRKSHVE